MTENSNPWPETAMADTREMLIVHRVFRREFAALPIHVRDVAAGDVARASTVAAHVRLMTAGLHLHHEGEDEELWPLIAARTRTRGEVTARMEAQHGQLAALVIEAGRLLPDWVASPHDPEPLAQVLEALHGVLSTHLAEEEAEILPLAAAHITAAEWARLGDHARRGMRPRELPLMFGAVLEECDADERAMILAHLPLPLRLIARPLLEPIYRRYIAKVRAAGG
jgi:hemerythrin-like domain-containing protein